MILVVMLGVFASGYLIGGLVVGVLGYRRGKRDGAEIALGQFAAW